MFATLSLGWNIIGGYTGYVSFGNVVFFGLGAYTTALLCGSTGTSKTSRSPSSVRCASASSSRSLLGVPILRLRGHYFGIATLGIALATKEIIANVDWLGGGSGFTVRPVEAFTTYYYAMWIVCALSMLATFSSRARSSATRSLRFGRTKKRRRCSACNPTRFKVIAWAISAAMAAAAGAVFAGANGFIDPPTAFAIDNNVFPIVMAILGGVGTVAGPFVGALILTAINETLWSHFPQIHTLFFGAVIVLVVVFLAARILWLVNVRGGWKGVFSSVGAFRV